MKRIPDSLRNKLFEIRCRSKSGQTITEEELKLCKRLMEQYPEDYSALSTEVFEATKPFGSTR